MSDFLIIGGIALGVFIVAFLIWLLAVLRDGRRLRFMRPPQWPSLNRGRETVIPSPKKNANIIVKMPHIGNTEITPERASRLYEAMEHEARRRGGSLSIRRDDSTATLPVIEEGN